MAGGYVQLSAAARGRFWVPNDCRRADAALRRHSAVAAWPPATSPPPPRRRRRRPRCRSSPWQRPAAARSPVPRRRLIAAPRPQPRRRRCPRPPPAPARGRRSPGFISAEAAQSTLKPAADGQLPDLQLQEGAASRRRRPSRSRCNPAGAVRRAGAERRDLGRCWCWLGVRPAGRRVNPSRRKRPGSDRGQLLRRRKHREQGLGALPGLFARPSGPTASGDFKTEREHYRQVLDMLRAERGADEQGVDRQPRRDKELEDEISVLLSDS